MASQKKTTKKKQDSIEEFVGLATDLKEIVVNLNQRVSEIEAVVKRIRERMGL